MTLSIGSHAFAHAHFKPHLYCKNGSTKQASWNQKGPLKLAIFASIAIFWKISICKMLASWRKPLKRDSNTTIDWHNAAFECKLNEGRSLLLERRVLHQFQFVQFVQFVVEAHRCHFGRLLIGKNVRINWSFNWNIEKQTFIILMKRIKILLFACTRELCRIGLITKRLEISFSWLIGLANEFHEHKLWARKWLALMSKL